MKNENQKQNQNEKVDQKDCSNNRNTQNSRKKKSNRRQPKKDSSSKRVNFDNTRIKKFEEDTKKHKGYNDISWYALNPELMRAAASIPFATIMGNPTQVGVNKTITLPGIMVLNWQPNFGVGGTNTAMNQAANDIYSFLVHANSRNYNYEPSDLMIMLQAGMQPFLLIGSMMRAYGIVKTYAEQNRYLPDSVLTALGFNPGDFRTKLGQIWFDINNMIARTQQLWIPNVMPILQRWFWLNSNVYKDAEGARSQMYVLNQCMYYRYLGALTQYGGGMIPVMLPKSSGTGSDPFTPGKFNSGGYPITYNWSDWVQVFDIMMSELLTDEDRGVILGDILNAYGLDKLYALSPIGADYRIEPIYNAEVLTQIENSTAATGFNNYGIGQAPAVNKSGSSNIWPIVGDIQPTSMRIPGRPILNFHHDGQPTPEEIVIATRLAAAGVAQVQNVYLFDPSDSTVAPATKTVAIPLVSGSEIIVDRYIITGVDGNLVCVPFNNAVMNSTAIVQYVAFDWAPFLYELNSTWTAATSEYDIVGIVGDYDNFTVLQTPELGRLHEMAFYSLFGVPQTWIGGSKAK